MHAKSQGDVHDLPFGAERHGTQEKLRHSCESSNNYNSGTDDASVGFIQKHDYIHNMEWASGRCPDARATWEAGTNSVGDLIERAVVVTRESEVVADGTMWSDVEWINTRCFTLRVDPSLVKETVTTIAFLLKGGSHGIIST